MRLLSVKHPYFVNGTPLADAVVRAILDTQPVEVRNRTLFWPLPPEHHRLCGECGCPVCAPAIGPRQLAAWDTLAATRVGRTLKVWTVHYPGAGQ